MSERFVPDVSKTHDEVVGTYSGMRWHLNRKQPVCGPCAHAASAWQADYRVRGKCAKGLGWPLTLRRTRTPARFKIEEPKLQPMWWTLP
jgi:hypothetical protein